MHTHTHAQRDAFKAPPTTACFAVLLLIGRPIFHPLSHPNLAISAFFIAKYVTAISLSNHFHLLPPETMDNKWAFTVHIHHQILATKRLCRSVIDVIQGTGTDLQGQHDLNRRMKIAGKVVVRVMEGLFGTIAVRLTNH